MGSGGSKKVEDADSDDSEAFPCPAILNKHKEAYLNSKPKPAKPSAPAPPVVRRSTLLESTNFSEIDDHAKNTPLEITAESYEALAEYLTKRASTDLEKLRAIYVFLGTLSPHAVVRFMTKNDLEAKDCPLLRLVLIMVGRKNKEYARLFRDLCKVLHIPCEVINGSVKGARYKPGQRPAGQNSWCAVFVEGGWYFVDPHWGGSYLMSAKTIETIARMSAKGMRDGKAPEPPDERLCDESWFLTEAETMIFSHFPDDPTWQLLPRPVSKEDFAKLAWLQVGFFELGLMDVKPCENVVETEDGKVVFEIGLPRDKMLNCQFDLVINTVEGVEHYVNRTMLNKYVFQEERMNRMIFTLDLPKAGRYTFGICGSDARVEGAALAWIVKWGIICYVPSVDAEPQPDNTLVCWGAGAHMKSRGIFPADEEQAGFIEATDGLAELHFCTNGNDMVEIEPVLELIQDDNDLNHVQDSVRYYFTSESEFTIAIHTPVYGEYILKVMAKAQGNEHFEDICRYLIKSERGCSHIRRFPPSLINGRIGNLEVHHSDSTYLDDPDSKIIALSHKNPILTEVNGGEVEFKFETILEAHLEVDLIRYNPDFKGKPEYLSDYVISIIHATEWTFKVKFPKSGIYIMEIYNTVSSASELMYLYVINVVEPKQECFPYPKIISPIDGLRILKPESGLLPEQEDIVFEIEATGADVLCVHGEDRIPMVEDGGIWTCTKNTGLPGEELKIVVSTKGADEFKDQREQDVASFKVLSTQEYAKVKELQQRAVQVAEKQREAREKENEAENKLAQERREQRQAMRAERLHGQQERAAEYRQEVVFSECGTPVEERNASRWSDYHDENGNSRMSYRRIKTKGLKAREDPDGAEWRKYHTDMITRMQIDKLREATRKRNVEQLEKALEEARNADLNAPEDVKKAEDMLAILKTKKDLHEAYKTNDPAYIRSVINDVKSKGRLYVKDLQHELHEATVKADSLDRQRSSAGVLVMSPATMSEVRRIHHPAAGFQDVIQATLLLLGYDEERTAEWGNCLKLFNPRGERGLNKKVLDFDVDKVHPEISARAKEILDKYELKRIQAISHSASTFYVWSMGVIDEVKKQSTGEGGKVKPANIQRQQEIFGVQPLYGSSSPPPFRARPYRRPRPAVTTIGPSTAAADSVTPGVDND